MLVNSPISFGISTMLQRSDQGAGCIKNLYFQMSYCWGIIWHTHCIVIDRLIESDEIMKTKENDIQREQKRSKDMKPRLHLPINNSTEHWHFGRIIGLFVILSLIITVVPAKAVTSDVSYLYTLSNFNGPVKSIWANIYIDKENSDVYVIDRDIRIFNESGMEVYTFGDDRNLGSVFDLTVDGHGNSIIISRKNVIPDILLLNYRGEQKSKIELQNLPTEYSQFSPDRVIYHEDKLYFAQTSALRIAVTDMNGIFQNGHDLASMLDVADSKRGDYEMTGFKLDRNGNILFTVSVLFQAFRLAPDGSSESFGKSGGGPGTFGVVSGIASDEKGYIYIADKLRCVVLVFDNDLEFVTEFGFRGNRPGNLIVPDDIDVDRNGRVYVSQAGGRGVSVFSVAHN